MPNVQGPPSLAVPTPRSAATATPKAPLPTVKAAAKAAPTANPLGLTPQELNAIGQEATAAQLPQLQAIQQAQAQDASTAKAQEQATTGYNAALAGILQQIAPQTQAGFQNAAGSDAAFAKGFSDGLSHVQAQAGQQNNDVLGVSGGQVQANQVAGQTGGTGVTNALYGLTGYIPATGLASEGAAFGAAASAMPRTAAGEGAEQIQRLTAQELANQNAFGQQKANLAAQIPGLRLGYGNQLLTAQANQLYKNAVLGIDTSKLGLAASTAATKASQANTKLAQSAVNTTSLVQTRKAAAAAAAARLGISQENAQTAAERAATASSIATKKLTISKAAAQAKKASVPASLIHEANAAADILYGGIAPKQHYVAGTGFQSVPGTGQPAELYPAARAKLLGMGPNTPAWQAQVQKILDARYAPGEGGRPPTAAQAKLNKTIASNAKTGALFKLPGTF